MSSEYDDQLKAMIENTPDVAIQGFDSDARITFWNTASTKLYGYKAEDALGKRLLDLGFWTQEQENQYRQMINGILSTGKAAPMREWPIRAVDGREKVILSTLFPFRYGRGQPIVVCMDVEITERKKAEQALRASKEHAHELADRLRLLLRELDHRVKNNLTSLHALVDLYARSSDSVLAFARAMHGKLDAMRAAHDMTAAVGGAPITFRVLLDHLERFHEPGSNNDGTLVLNGPELQIPPRQVGPMVMVLEELFSNATRHGSWSQNGGRVEVSWDVLGDSELGKRVRMVWKEPRKPILAAPTSRGVGLGLIEAFSRFELCGHARFYFNEDGYRCEIECMLDAALKPGDRG